jgi:hypothetical protein
MFRHIALFTHHLWSYLHDTLNFIYTLGLYNWPLYIYISIILIIPIAPFGRLLLPILFVKSQVTSYWMSSLAILSPCFCWLVFNLHKHHAISPKWWRHHQDKTLIPFVKMGVEAREQTVPWWILGIWWLHRKSTRRRCRQWGDANKHSYIVDPLVLCLKKTHLTIDILQKKPSYCSYKRSY